jgi:enoyl-CoA hydratase/carnithine racemase
MAAQTVDANQALSMGLVHQIFPEEGFTDAVAAFARHLAGISREALGLAKVAIDAAADGDRTTARNVDRIANTLLVLSAEHRAKVAEFPA